MQQYFLIVASRVELLNIYSECTGHMNHTDPMLQQESMRNIRLIVSLNIVNGYIEYFKYILSIGLLTLF